MTSGSSDTGMESGSGDIPVFESTSLLPLWGMYLVSLTAIISIHFFVFTFLLLIIRFRRMQKLKSSKRTYYPNVDEASWKKVFAQLSSTNASSLNRTVATKDDHKETVFMGSNGTFTISNSGTRLNSTSSNNEISGRHSLGSPRDQNVTPQLLITSNSELEIGEDNVSIYDSLQPTDEAAMEDASEEENENHRSTIYSNLSSPSYPKSDTKSTHEYDDILNSHQGMGPAVRVDKRFNERDSAYYIYVPEIHSEKTRHAPPQLKMNNEYLKILEEMGPDMLYSTPNEEELSIEEAESEKYCFIPDEDTNPYTLPNERQPTIYTVIEDDRGPYSYAGTLSMTTISEEDTRGEVEALGAEKSGEGYCYSRPHRLKLSPPATNSVDVGVIKENNPLGQSPPVGSVTEKSVDHKYENLTDEDWGDRSKNKPYENLHTKLLPPRGDDGGGHFENPKTWYRLMSTKAVPEAEVRNIYENDENDYMMSTETWLKRTKSDCLPTSPTQSYMPIISREMYKHEYMKPGTLSIHSSASQPIDVGPRENLGLDISDKSHGNNRRLSYDGNKCDRGYENQSMWMNGGMCDKNRQRRPVLYTPLAHVNSDTCYMNNNARQE